MKLARPYAVVALWSAALITVPQPAQAQGNDGMPSLSMGVDASHAYFFRGIKQEREGIVLQPFADASFTLFEGGEGLTNVTLTIGQWNSLHSGPSGADGPAANVASWYESDFFTGVTLGLENWEAGVVYTSYLSPNDSFGTIQELSLSLGMDDSELLNGFALAPHVGIAIELSGQADGGASEGAYLELGVEPGLQVLAGRASVGFPVTLGVSLNNYYENGAGFNDTFGYVDVGAVGSFPLGVPESVGSWVLTGGVHLLALGNYLEAINDGDQFQVVGSFGFSIGY